MLSDGVRQRCRERVGQAVAERWRLVRLIGSGGMGGVYEGVDRDGRKVAIKCLHPHLSTNSEIRKRFLAEAYLANRVYHPAIVRVEHADVAEDGCTALIMELLTGECVESLRVKWGGQLPLDLVIDISKQLLDVMRVAHDAGVVHRDIKPANLWLEPGGTLRVLDFGIAKSLESPSAEPVTTASLLLGTPGFMAPEHARGRSDLIDSRTDIWAIGATMFMLLTGRSVHHAATRHEQLALAVCHPAARLMDVHPLAADWVAHVVDRALEYDPARRWQSAAQMLEVLGRGPSSGLVSQPSDTLRNERSLARRVAKGKRRSRLVVGLGALMATAAGTSPVQYYSLAADIVQPAPSHSLSPTAFFTSAEANLALVPTLPAPTKPPAERPKALSSQPSASRGAKPVRAPLSDSSESPLSQRTPRVRAVGNNPLDRRE